MSGEHWEHFAHDADIGVRGIGPTREAAFEQGALALMHAIGDPERIGPARWSRSPARRPTTRCCSSTG